MPMTPRRQKLCFFKHADGLSRCRADRGPISSGARSSTAPTTARVFHSSVASPQPNRPGLSVSTLTKTQFRISAFTMTSRMPVIFNPKLPPQRR